MPLVSLGRCCLKKGERESSRKHGARKQEACSMGGMMHEYG